MSLVECGLTLAGFPNENFKVAMPMRYDTPICWLYVSANQTFCSATVFVTFENCFHMMTSIKTTEIVV